MPTNDERLAKMLDAFEAGRFMGADGKAIAVPKKAIGRVLLVMPRYSRFVDIAASTGLYHPTQRDSDLQVTAISPGGSLLANIFNVGWANACDLYEAGQIDAFAMLHADIGPQAGWLDVLHSEMLRVGADVISAIVPIKDDRGLTSTAVDNPADPWRVHRLTTAQVKALPETFTDTDVGGELLLNTGCWMVRLGPWCDQVCFTIRDIIRKEGGKRRARVQPEDWDASRQFRRLGLKLAATRKVCLNHHGEFEWDNQAVFGWETDTQNGTAIKGQAIPAPSPEPDADKHPAGVEGWLTVAEGQALARFAAGKDVLEIGAYCGLSTIWLARAANSVVTVDTFDGRGTGEPRRDLRGTMLANLTAHGVKDKVTIREGMSEEVLPQLTQQFDVVFIDGSHDLTSVLTDARLAMARLKPDGLLLFHDYGTAYARGDGRVDPEVTEAVNRIISAGAQVLSRVNSLIAVRPTIKAAEANGKPVAAGA